jgi:hypothetical protein
MGRWITSRGRRNEHPIQSRVPCLSPARFATALARSAPRLRLRQNYSPWVGPGHLNGKGLWRIHLSAQLEDHRLGAPQPLQDGGRGRDLVSDRTSFHCEESSFRRDQRHRPAKETLQRSHSARGDHVEHFLAVQLLGTRTNHRDVEELQLSGHLGEVGRPSKQRLDQGHLQVRPSNCEHHPWQTRPTSDVADCGTFRSRGTSRGPIRPRITPSVASDAAYPSMRLRRSEENTLRARSGVAGGAEGDFEVSRETSFTEMTFSQVGRRRSGGARHPRTPTCSRPRPPRRGRPCARRETSGPARPADLSP